MGAGKSAGQIPKHLKQGIGAAGGGYHGDDSIFTVSGLMDFEGNLAGGIVRFCAPVDLFALPFNGEAVHFAHQFDFSNERRGHIRTGFSSGKDLPS